MPNQVGFRLALSVLVEPSLGFLQALAWLNRNVDELFGGACVNSNETSPVAVVLLLE